MRDTVILNRLGHSGEGVGRKGDKVVFIEGGLPGEEVEYTLTLDKKSYSKGQMTRVIKASPDRVDPPCPYYDRCGGCQLMHLSYSGQLEYKRERVKETLRRIGGLDVQVEPTRPSPREFGYRNKILLPVREHIGLYARGSHEIIPIDRCLIHNPRGDALYEKILPIVKKIPPYNEDKGSGELRHLLLRTGDRVLVGLILAEKPTKVVKEVAQEIAQFDGVAGVCVAQNRRRDNVIVTSPFEPLCGDDHIFEHLCGFKFKLSAGAFFQVNPLQAEQLYLEALERSGVTEKDQVVDAFCGVGTLACIFAKKCHSITGIEVVQAAISDAHENAKINRIVNAKFICGKAEEKLKSGADIVILNPPRKGCDPRVLKTLIKSRPKTIVYVSCDPATLARDLKCLVEGGFHIGSVTPFDMFPQTAHVETLALIYS